MYRKNNAHQPGYILVLTLLLVFMATAVVTRLLQKAFADVRMNRYVVDREHAKKLALQGIVLTQAQCLHSTKKKKKNTAGKEQKEDPIKEFYVRLLSILNRWQTFSFTQKADGFDGNLYVYVSCEDGKLPLNFLFDFEKKKLVDKDGFSSKKLLENVVIQQKGAKKMQEKKLIEELDKFLKDKKEPLEDVSQLLESKYFKGLSETFFLPIPTGKEKKLPLVLSDIFTTESTERKIQPFFFSNAVRDIFDCKKLPDDKKKRDELIKKVVKNSKPTMVWEKEWKSTLGQLYAKEYNQVAPQLSKLFDQAVGARKISVLSYGKIGTVTQGVYAVLVRSEDKKGKVAYAVKKLCWL